MADVFLGKDFDAKTFPFRQPVPFEASANSAVPWGQAIVNETFESQAIGAGDTGTLNIDIKLPSDYVALLRTFKFQAYDPSASINWARGVIGFAYQQPGGPYKTSVATFPEKEYMWAGLLSSDQLTAKDRFSSAIRYRFFNIGSPQTSVPEAVTNEINDLQIKQIPLWIPPQSDSLLQSRSCVIYLENNTQNSAANDFLLNMVFDLYTLEQAYAAGVMSSPRVF